MKLVFFTLSVCLMFTSQAALAVDPFPAFVKEGVSTQQARQEDPTRHRLNTFWVIFEKGQLKNIELFNALDMEAMESQGVEVAFLDTLNPTDFYVVDDVEAGVFPRLMENKDGATVYVPFEMSIRFAKTDKLFEMEQGTINVKGELRFTTASRSDLIDEVKVEIFDYSQGLERLSFETDGSPLQKYNEVFVKGVMDILPVAFFQGDDLEELRDLLIALQIGDRPETLIENSQN